jgi:response regulator RpfG family c-di-GMP phosphodiesterase
MNNQLTILVVDDEPSIRLTLRHCLEDKFTVLDAADVAGAKEHLKRNRVHLVLSGYHIGAERLTDVAAMLPAGIPLVGMSGLPKQDCYLPPELNNIPWLEKGSLRFEDIRLTIMEALQKC